MPRKRKDEDLLEDEAIKEALEETSLEEIVTSLVEVVVDSKSEEKEEPDANEGSTQPLLGEADRGTDGGSSDSVGEARDDDAQDDVGSSEATPEASASRYVDTRSRTVGGSTVWTS